VKQDLIRLREAGTAAIADVFDAMGVEPVVLENSIRPVGTAKAFAGEAYTVTGEAHSYRGGDPEKLGAIDAMPAGCVSVWAGKDIRGACCFGDLLATAMQARGCAAAVVDGGVRDTDFLRGLEMPVMARYVTPAQAITRWKVRAAQVPVEVRGALRDWVAVAPGDVIVGDADGVLCVPAGQMPAVMAALSGQVEPESAARKAIAQGMPLLEALERFGHL
jgi:regulator of RNase E activity RraA